MATINVNIILVLKDVVFGKNWVKGTQGLSIISSTCTHSYNSLHTNLDFEMPLQHRKSRMLQNSTGDVSKENRKEEGEEVSEREVKEE